MCFVPSKRVSSCHSCDVNCAPRSVVIVDGTPNRAIQPDKKALATVEAEMSLIGIASDHRVKRSMHVSRYVKPLDGGSGPTRSMWTLLNRLFGSSNRPRGVAVCLCIFACWHAKHSFVHCRTSTLILGQIKRDTTSFRVAFIPGWDNSCKERKAALLNYLGTHGLGFPVDTSHNTGLSVIGKLTFVKCIEFLA